MLCKYVKRYTFSKYEISHTHTHTAKDLGLIIFISHNDELVKQLNFEQSDKSSQQPTWSNVKLILLLARKERGQRLSYNNRSKVALHATIENAPASTSLALNVELYLSSSYKPLKLRK